MNQELKNKEFIYGGAAIVGQVKQESTNEDVESEFLTSMKEREVLVVKVTGMRESAVTVRLKGDYMGIIPKAEVSSRMYVRNNMDELIGQNIPVVIKSFNREEKTAILSRTSAVNELRKEFLEEILPKLDTINKNGMNYKNYIQKFDEKNDPYYNEYPIVKAKVMSYDSEKRRVTVNIAGLDLLGTMDISKFDYKFIYNPETYIEQFLAPNTVIEVALLAFYDNTEQKTPSTFVVSRRHALSDPWDGIDKKLSVGDIIVVKALEKKDSHFFGEYDNFALDVKCYYPAEPDKVLGPDEKYGRRLITPGKEYKVRVEIVNEQNKILTASYIAEL